MAEEQNNAQSNPDENLPAIPKRPEQSIQLGNMNSLDLTGLTEEQRQAIQTQYAKGIVDSNKRAIDMKVDISALDSVWGSMASHAKDISEAGDSVTMTHTATTTAGRFEIIMGNTENAAKGKFSRSQVGDKDNILMYIIIGAVVITIIALILSR